MIHILFPKSNHVYFVTSFKILNNMAVYILLDIYIYIKAEDVAIYLSFGMYGNVFCMTRGNLVG